LAFNPFWAKGTRSPGWQEKDGLPMMGRLCIVVFAFCLPKPVKKIRTPYPSLYFFILLLLSLSSPFLFFFFSSVFVSPLLPHESVFASFLSFFIKTVFL